MIPIADDNPDRTHAVVTWAIIALCIAVFVWQLTLGSQIDAVTDVLGFTPASLGGVQTPVPQGYISLPPYITIFTAMFVHGGFLHIGGNMLFLWVFGDNVEDAMGHWRYLLFYLVCGVGAALLFAASAPGSLIPMIGASGAISGVIAAYVLLFPRSKVTVIVPLGIVFFPFAVRAVWVLGIWFVLQFVSALLSASAADGVAFWAHIGGFVVGLVLTPLFKSAQYRLFGGVRPNP